MKIGIFSHCTIDEISRAGTTIETAGGPACYCGLTAKNLKFNVEFHTKIGLDFGFCHYLEKNEIFIPQNALAKNPTTRFLDRKSTRLNSSHVAISYAVFCLKKKKKKTKKI